VSPRKNRFTPRTVTFGDGRSVTFRSPRNEKRAAARAARKSAKRAKP
jgi:hypothetical protein